jgi:hypothetical protein
VRQEIIEVQAELMPEAMNKAANLCCSRFSEFDVGRPIRARIDFYGVKMILQQTDKNEHGVRGVERTLVYSFLIVYEDG